MRISPVTKAIIDGTEDLSTWTQEELERGIRRGQDGRFRKPPRLVAKAVHDELVRRRMSRAYDLLRKSTYDAVRLLREVVNDDEADLVVRVKAAELILDRVLGKAPQTVALDVTANSAPWQRMAATAIVSIVGNQDQIGASEVVEGEVVPED